MQIAPYFRSRCSFLLLISSLLSACMGSSFEPVINDSDNIPILVVQKSVSANLGWCWPTQGKQMATLASSNRQGLEFKGKIGQTILAASSGEVVYSGSGLSGYGNLIIIKHSQGFLSAYAHNSHLLVGEGVQVSACQPIAEMGDSDINEVKLYFEIRKDGKTVDPRQYLPAKNGRCPFKTGVRR